jgi:hypothetical protein
MRRGPLAENNFTDVGQSSLNRAPRLKDSRLGVGITAENLTKVFPLARADRVREFYTLGPLGDSHRGIIP